MVKTQGSFLPLVLVKVNAKRLQILMAVVASFNQYGFMMGSKTQTLNFRAVVFGSQQDKFAFSVLLCACSLENAS